jgi:hypothetical protein
VLVRLGSFTKVKAATDEMVQQEATEQKAFCTKVQPEREGVSRSKMDEFVASIKKLNGLLRPSWREERESDCEEQNAEFQSAVSDQCVTKEFLATVKFRTDKRPEASRWTVVVLLLHGSTN